MCECVVQLGESTHTRIHGHDDAKSSKIRTPISLALKPFTTSLMRTKAGTGVISPFKQLSKRQKGRDQQIQ